MRSRPKKTIISILTSFLDCLFLISMSFALSSSKTSKTEAGLAIFSNSCPNVAGANCFISVDFKDSQERNTCEQIFSMTYSENFSKTSTRLMTVSDDNKVASFKTYFNDVELPFCSSVTSGKTYSNDEEMLRLETICINIYTYRERAQEHFYDPKKFDGFVYIPDYYADYIIEHFYPDSNYFDLINNANEYFFCLRYGEKEFKYKIANIFHVNGFLDHNIGSQVVKYNDYDVGKKLNYFFNGFCFVSNYGHYSYLNEDFHTTLFYQLEPKKYEIDSVLKSTNRYKSYYKAGSVKTDIYYFDGKLLNKYENGDRLMSSYNATYSLDLWQFAFAFIAGFVFFVFSIFIYLKGLYGDKQIVLLGIASSSIIYMFISFVFKNIFTNNYHIYLFFNGSTMATSIFLFLVSGFLFVYNFRKGDKGNGF